MALYVAATRTVRIMGNLEDDDREMKARLEKLSSALDAKRADSQSRDSDADSSSNVSSGRAMSLGFRVLSEFVAGIVVGCLIGWQLDVWFSTTPLFLIVFLTLGTAASFWNVYRIAAGPTSGGGSGR